MYVVIFLEDYERIEDYGNFKILRYLVYFLNFLNFIDWVMMMNMVFVEKVIYIV